MYKLISRLQVHKFHVDTPVKYIGKYDKCETRSYYPRLNNNKTSIYPSFAYGPYWTPLFTCDHCGFTSTPKKVQYRPDIHWLICILFPEDSKNPYLCMSCWAKLQSFKRKVEEYKEIKSLIAKLNRERLKCQKLLTQAN